LPDTNPRLRSALAKRYRLERELGRGGMATVFLAHDLKHDRPVALKVLLPELAAALGPERFEREIKLAARLQHPHILTVHDSGEAAGQLWFTMPFVEGESLRERLTREKQLPVEDALRIAREAAEALDHAHRHGVVHRDIKPENIMLTEGHALVADFGIARALSGDEQQLTSTGIAIGTPAYMSPEQASGTHELDARTDVYALGCVLYEMLAGEPPYTGPTAQAVIARALTETPRPIHPMRAGVPEAVDAVIGKAMAVTAADRYASAAEFARALEHVVRSPAPPRERGKGGEVRWFAQRPLFAALLLGVLLGGGALFAWRRTHGGEHGGTKLIVVLPFENLGSPDDEYFADGMTDEVRGKLSTLPGLRVIARGSSTPYKKTAKSPQQIARELGAQYLLTATVRWEKTAGGASRVHVSPELVQVEDGASPTTKWQAPFDAALTDVFQVQADIATRVAQALDVALGDSTRQQLAEQPTQSLAAYDAYLRGEEVSQSLAAYDPPTLRRAAAYYAQAVALDSTFVQAWAQFSQTYSLLYFFFTPANAEVARRAAERALDLAPNRVEGHVAMGTYYYWVAKDNARAIQEFGQGQRIAPNDVALLNALALPEQSLGRWEAALTHLRQAQKLDPRSVTAPGGGGLTEVLLSLRRYPEAQEAADRAFALAPSNLGVIEDRTMVELAQGDMAGARAALAAVPKEVDPAALVAWFAVQYDLYWVLDEAQQALVLQLPPSAYDGSRSIWGIVLAQIYWLRGDQARARLYADSARIASEQQLRAAPEDAQSHVFLGLALAYLGRKADAIREGERGVHLAKDAFFGPYYQHQLARIYMLVGEPEKALDQLEPLLKIPYYLSPGWLKIDPNFDPLRGNPRFQRLVASSPVPSAGPAQ
jgi:serine/threonine-protein kinase